MAEMADLRGSCFEKLDMLRLFQRGVSYKLMRLPGFGLKMWLLMTKGSAIRSICLSH